MPPISMLIKPASGMCNMTCDYCFYCDETQKRMQESYGFMTEETLKNVIRKTMPYAEGAISFSFQGGEPTLRGIAFFEKVVELQNKYNKNGVRINNSLQTNGYALDENWCNFLKKNNFLVGISIDGTKDIHNAYRHSKSGELTYERIIHTTELMDQYHVDYNILTVVNSKVAENITEIYDEYRKHKWNYQQYISCLDPFGEIHGINEYALHPDEYGEFLIKLFELWYTDWEKGKQPYIRLFDNYIGIIMGYLPEACDQRGCCGIQNVVEADGSVFPCDFYVMDKYKLGNFNTDRMNSINIAREKIGFLEESTKITEDCKNCRYYKICKGGCQRNRDFNPNTGLYKSYFCESFKLFFEICLNKMELICNTLKS